MLRCGGARSTRWHWANRGGALESGNWGEWGNTRAGLCNSSSSSFQPPGVVIKGSRAITKRNARCQRAEDALLIYLFSSLDFYLHGHWHVSGMEWNGKEERSSWVTLGCFSGGFRGGAEGELLQHPDAVCYLLFVKVLRARLFGARAKCQIGLMALMRIRVETKPTTNRTTNQPTNQPTRPTSKVVYTATQDSVPAFNFECRCT